MRRALIVGALLTTSCVQYGARDWFKEYEYLPLRSRAAFDLDCEARELSFLPLGSRAEGYDVIGVRGCAQTAIYVYRDDAWILNSVSEAGVSVRELDDKTSSTP